MKIAILCGGYGTRIRDVADNIPKPMIPIDEYPILWHIMKYYACYGYKEYILCLGYRGDVIRDFFINYAAHTSDFTIDLNNNKDIVYHNYHAPLDWNVTLAETGMGAMTGARIKRVEKYLSDEECFMLTYGDGVGNVDIDQLVAFHRSHGKILTVTGVRPPGRFGELISDDAGRVMGFNEKPQAAAGLISGGFFVCNRELFRYLNDAEDLVFEQEPIASLVRDQEMMVYEHQGFWQPMDTYRDYKLLHDLYESGKAPWKIW